MGPILTIGATAIVVFRRWHARSFERVIADHGGAVANPDAAEPKIGSIWDGSWYSRDRAIHLGGGWYCDHGPWN